MSDHNLLNNYIPLGAVAIVILTLASVIFWFSGIANRSEVTAIGLSEVQQTIKEYPNRREYDQLQSSVSRIETSVNQINDYLLKKK